MPRVTGPLSGVKGRKSETNGGIYAESATISNRIIVVVVAKYTSTSSLSAIILHLEGEEVFRSTKRKVDLSTYVRGRFTLA